MCKLLATFILCLAPIAAWAQAVTPPGTAALVCAYNTSPPALTSGLFAYVQCDSAGKLITAGGGGGGSGTVTSVGETFTGGLISVAGSPITTSGTFALTVAGTSGGIPYFSGATTWASSAALTANALVLGGGAGAAPASTTTGTGVITALGVSVGSAGAFVVNGGALGTPSSGTATNLTGLPIAGLTGLGTGVATALAANVNGSGAISLTTSPTFVTPALGVATAASLAVAGATLGSFAVSVTGIMSITNGSNDGITINRGAASAQLAFQNAVGPSYSMFITGDSNGSGGPPVISLASTGNFTFQSVTNLNTGAADTNFSRVSAGILGVGTGAQGSVAGKLVAATLTSGVTGLTLTTGAIGIATMTASASAPGAAGAKMELVCGTVPGTTKLTISGGTSATATTIVDNIGAGVTGC